MKKKTLLGFKIAFFFCFCLILLNCICNNFDDANSLYHNNNRNQHFEFNNKIKITEEIKNSGDPGSFILSSDKYQLYINQKFNLSWTPSNGADNYSIYVSNKNITILNLNEATLVKDNITSLSYELSNNNPGSYYYVAVAYNESGYTLSNNVKIKILTSVAASDNDDDAESQANLWIINTNILILSLIIIGIISAALIIGYRINHQYSHRFPSLFDDNDNESEKIKNQNEMVKSSKQIINNFIEKQNLFLAVKNVQFDSNFDLLKKSDLTSISDNILKKIDEFNWKDEIEKEQFIYEIISLTPNEREELIDYMLRKVKRN